MTVSPSFRFPHDRQRHAGDRLSLIAASLLACMALAACSDQSQNPRRNTADVKPEVSVVALHPKSVALTASVPGRTVASKIAEVRPQVTGIIRSLNFKEGSEVKEGDVLYEINPAPYEAAYDSAVAALEKAQAALPSAQGKVDRYRALKNQAAVSQQDLDDALSTLAQAKADIASAKAAQEAARINLDYTKIRAPISGRIDASAVTVGALVTAAQTAALATINQLDPINVDVTQSSTNLLAFRRAVEEGRIHMTGEDVSIRLTLEDGSKYPSPGKFAFLEASVSETLGTVTARASFPNPDRLLLPGMYVRATVEEGVAPNSFLVPQRAVAYNAKGEATAMFVDRAGKVEQRVLKVTGNVGNSWLVDGGIKDGERVVVEGLQKIRDGQNVKADEVEIDDATGELKQASASTSVTQADSTATVE